MGPSYRCLGCKSAFSEGRAYSQHLRQCKKHGKALGDVLTQRHAAELGSLREKREAKRQKLAMEQPTSFATKPDEFGLYRVYPVKPRRTPDSPTLDALCDGGTFSDPDALRAQPTPIPLSTLALDRPAYAPFANYSTFSLVYWQNNESNTKSNDQMGVLTELMQHPDFRPEDVAGFSASREVQRLDNYYEEGDRSILSPRDGWQHGTVKVRVPKEGVSYPSEDDAPEFAVDGAYYRSLVDIVDTAYRSPSVKDWEIIPSKLFWLHKTSEGLSRSRCASPSPSVDSTQSSDSSCSQTSTSSHTEGDPYGGERIYSESYHADAIWEEDARMRLQPREAGDPEDLEYAIAPVGLWSDSTHLTSFGSAKMWPIYAYILSQSKYERGRPSAFAAHHLAYIPSLPDSIQDWYTRVYMIAATAAVLTFLKRELMQQVLLLLMDDRFMYAYVHGLVIFCGDDIQRRMFIRFILYAADYPEKILLACLRYFARCPCPRCRINKDKIIEMGTANDIARRNWIRVDNTDLNHRINLTRRWIFEKGMPITSVYISRILDEMSITPTRSAFSTRLRPHGFNFYSLFVPDLLHEFELGVWKSIFTHLLRLLYAVGNDKIQAFNKRFRKIPTYGRSTIRKFSSNISEQAKLAARDYEARLKCVMPAIEGLIDGHRADDSIVLDLCFDSATWHALAKLREQTQKTLSGLDVFTVEIGKSVRVFSKETCARYITVELPREAAARGRRAAAMRSSTTLARRKEKIFNCTTYKFHALCDYPAAIRACGTTDNYSTQLGELEHKTVKRFYKRTNKINFAFQIAQHTRCAEKLRIIKARVDASHAIRLAATSSQPHAGLVDPSSHSAVTAASSTPADTHLEPEHVPHASPADHYYIADSQRENSELTEWLRSHAPHDPALKNFSQKLKDHVLCRIAQSTSTFHDGFTPAERARVVILGNKLYWHRVLRINYTTYDRRRSQDTVNPRTHPDILLLAPQEYSRLHKYWYARVLKIFHVNVRTIGGPFEDGPERMDVLFVRWLRLDGSAPGGFASKRLHRLEFVPDRPQDVDAEEAFGFVNPADVVRGAHLIPAFAHGRTTDYPGPSMARDVPGGQASSNLECADSDSLNTDYKYLYVNFFVDRDMFLRYYGGGIGHQGLEAAPTTAMDDENPDEEWRDMDEEDGMLNESGPDRARDSDEHDMDRVDASLRRPEEEEDLGATMSEALTEDDLLRLVPELSEGDEQHWDPNDDQTEDLDDEQDEDEPEADDDEYGEGEDEESGGEGSGDEAAEEQVLGVAGRGVGGDDLEEDGEDFVDEYELEGYAAL
ncbi:hypothetical protein PYCCODRAFT_1442622 [Trametes coccinea BRFM310]|uniref:Uncharacterized protein n=1 Tax=Trametes coccinea (strain BRFM310) TaxID=1353009 RepID=A0A1Y2IZE5_TRAC3|nr:hypothetical protein PYCCODRAFT_1442622 [Trametes coccinea BRFM310]